MRLDDPEVVGVIEDDMEEGVDMEVEGMLEVDEAEDDGIIEEAPEDDDPEALDIDGEDVDPESWKIW